MVHQPELCLQQRQTSPLSLGLRLLTHPCCQQCLCWCPRTFLSLQCPVSFACGQRMLTIPDKQSFMCMPTLHQSSASIPQQNTLACPSRCRSSRSQQPEQSLGRHRFTYCVAQTHSWTAQGQIQPQTAPPCQPHQRQRQWQPQDGRAGSTISRRILERAPCSP